MTWTSFTFSVGQVLTAAQMNNLYSNFAALAAGDSGAPDIVEAALHVDVQDQLVNGGDGHTHAPGSGGTQIPTAGIALLAVGPNQLAAGAVIRSKITTSTASTSGSISAGSRVSITMSPYSFFPMIYGEVAANRDVFLAGNPTEATSADSPRFGIRNDGSVSADYSVYYRYISA